MAYNYYIVIQQKSVSADTYGERDATWTTYKSVWADMDVPGGSLTYETEMPVYADARVFKIHTHDAPSVTTKMRISYTENSVTDYYYIRNIRKGGRLHTILTATAYDDE